jgi:hypothetical protein
MVIFKTENVNDGRVFIGLAENDNPHNFGSGKYIKKAVSAFGASSFKREILEEFDETKSLSEAMDRLEAWIKQYKADNPKYGYNESIAETVPQPRRLTKKIQVLMTPDDEDVLNAIILQKSMEFGIRPMTISKYVRQLILQHIAEEITPEKQILLNK